MLTCIACSKQVNTNRSLHEPPQDDENAATTPSTKQAIKAITSQIKDMAVKASGAYKHCKPCSGSTRHDGRESDVGSASDRFYGSYRRTGSSPRIWGKGMEAKLKSVSSGSGSGTPVSVSGRSESVFFMEEDEQKEWTAQVEPGVMITFVSLPKSEGGNDLKRIRFSREIFNKLQAQKWWTENYDKLMELYNVQKLNHHSVPLPPPQPEDENLKPESVEDSPMTPPLSNERPTRKSHATAIGYSPSDSLQQHSVQSHHHQDSVGVNSTPKLSNTSVAETETSSVDASARSSSSREVDHSGELSMSNASDIDNEWVEEDEPGVYITVRALPGGARELRRVRFSREKFGETHARTWWEENRARIQQQYL